MEDSKRSTVDRNINAPQSGLVAAVPSSTVDAKKERSIGNSSGENPP